MRNRLVVFLCLCAFPALAARSLKSIEHAVPNVELSEMIDALRGEGPPSKEGLPLFVRIFGWACGRAESRDLPALAENFASLPDQSYYKSLAFQSLADAWMRLNIPSHLEDKPVFPPAAEPMPERANAMAPEFRQAAERCWQVEDPFRALMKSRTPDIDFQTHGAEYWKLAGQLFSGKNGPFTEKFLRYRWGGWCGTGSDQFRTPHAVALVIALVADRRWAAATGAALQVGPGDDFDGSLQVLRTTLEDPVTVLVGGLALGGFTADRESLAPLLAHILRLPGDDRVEKLIQLASHAGPKSSPLYFRALAKFVPTGPSRVSPDGNRIFGWGWGTSADNLDTISALPVGPAAQQRAWDFLCAQASAKLPIDAGEALARIFHEKRRPESMPALRQLLEHPSYSVAKEAASALEFLGEKAEIPAKLGPARYRLMVDGQPYTQRKIGWAVKRDGSSMWSETNTDDEGVASVPRDLFLDAAKVEQVALRSAEMSGPADPWFGVLLPPPPASDEVIPVEVTTKSLRVKLPIPRPEAQWKGETMEVVLWGLQIPEQQGIGCWSPAKFRLPVAREVDFAKLMPGPYRVEIRLRGATSWTGELAVGEVAEFIVPLQRASDVKFTAQMPKGWHPTVAIPELRQDGKRVSSDWDYENRFFRGVPEGRYVVHLPSSAEIRKRVMGLLPDGPEFDGTDVAFEVGPDSPVELDLGEIVLKAKSG